MTEHPVHDEGDADHVAAVLQDGKEQEQNGHLGKEAEHCSQTSQDPIHHQTCHHTSGSQAAECSSSSLLNSDHKGFVGPVSTHGPQGGNRNIIYKIHDCRKNRESQDPVCNDPVDLIRRAEFRRRFLYSLSDHLSDIAVTGIGDDTFHVVIHIPFQALRLCPDGCHGGGGQLQVSFHLWIPLKKLNGIPASQRRFHPVPKSLLCL